MPWGGHAEGVCTELDLGDLAPGFPEVVVDLKARDATESEFRISEFAKVIGRDGEENLVAECLVGFLVGGEGGLVFVEEAVDFADLGGGGIGRVNRVDGAVFWRDGGNVARD